MRIEGGGWRMSGKACESMVVFGDIARDVEVSGISSVATLQFFGCDKQCQIYPD
jgi:hypothetical protein